MKRIRLAHFLAILFLLFGCATDSTPHTQTHFVADVTKIRPWSSERAKIEPAYPILAHFQKGTKNLYYVAAHHSNSINSPTFKMIDRVLTAHPIQVIVLEGFPHSYGMNPRSMIKYGAKQGDNGYFTGGEPAFSIQRAVKSGINFTGGEPDETVIMKTVLDHGYTLQDLLGFYFVRQVPEYREDPSLAKETPETLYYRLENGMAHSLAISKEQVPSFEHFKNWYQRGNKTPFVLNDITSETPAPLPDGKLLTQKISAAVNIARNNFTVTVIAELLNKFDNVLVVYGGSHLIMQQPAIEEMLGSPVEMDRSQ